MKKLYVEIANTYISTLNLTLIVIGYAFFTSVFSFIFTDVENASRIVTIPYRMFSLAISIITIFLNYGTRFKLNFKHKILIVFWMLLIIRLICDEFFRSDIILDKDRLVQIWLYILAMTILPMYSVMKSYKTIDYSKLFSWIFSLSTVATIMIFATNDSFRTAIEERIDANVAFGSIATGHLGLTTLIMSLYALGRYKNNLLRIGIIAIMLIAFIVLLRAGSRGPILAAIVIFATYLITRTKNIILSLIFIIFALLVWYLLRDNIIQLVSDISPILKQRLFERANQISDRTPLYEYAVNAFLDNPIFGKSFAVYMSGFMTYSHNIILDSIMQLGMIGGAIILYLLVKSYSLIYKLLKIKSLYSWIGLLLLQQVTFLMLSSAIYLTPSFSILMVLLFFININNPELEMRKS